MAAPPGTRSDAVVTMLAEDSLDALVPGAVANAAGQATLAWLDAKSVAATPISKPKPTSKPKPAPRKTRNRKPGA